MLDEFRLLEKAKSPDTADNFENVCAEIIQLGNESRGEFNPTPHHRVAFYFPTGAFLAHTRNVQTLLRGLKQIGNPITTYIIVGTPPEAKFRQEFEGLGDHIVPITSADPVQHWWEIKRYCESKDIDAFIHVSTIQGMAYGSSIRCAKKHIWWSMKWHAKFPHIDAYFDSAGPNHPGKPYELRGATWHPIYVALPELFKPEHKDKALELRKVIKARTVYGCFARNEKYSPEYIDCVRKILDADRDSVYIYGAREAIIDFHPRATHVGWVDTSLWVQAIDVFLDTWPFPGGHVVYEAIAAHKPVVFMRTNAEQPFPLKEMMAERRSEPAFAEDAQGYVDLAKILAAGGLRTETARSHDFYTTHMRDEQRMAREFVAALNEVL